MFKQSIGLIETVGLACGVVAADVAVKAANVELIGYELTKGSGMVTVKVAGDVGSVNAAIDAAVAAVSEIGTVFSSKVIPRLGDGVEKLIYTKDTVGIEKKEEDIKEVQKEVPKEVPKEAPKDIPKASAKPTSRPKNKPKTKAKPHTSNTVKPEQKGEVKTVEQTEIKALPKIDNKKIDAPAVKK